MNKLKQMKISILKYAFVTLVFTLFLCFYTHAQSHRLSVSIHGTVKSNGKLVVALYRIHDHFPSLKSSFRHLTVHPHTGSTHVVFENLPIDNYAIAAYLDENSNGKMDKNFFGAPTESYGFSNDARELMHAPSFQKASFHFNKDLKIHFSIK